MSAIDRRQFLARTAQAGAALGAGAALVNQRVARAAGPNDKIALAVVGIHGRGAMLAADFAKRPDCEIAYLCDVDESLFGDRAKPIEAAQGRAPKNVQDFRRALDDKAVDAIVVATPDHWHALATIWGCQAGKDVYVEKPISHSPWEGRKMVEAARRYNRIVQVGTQNRSAPYNQSAKKYIADGKLGRIHMVRVYNQKGWPNAKAVPDAETPAGLDFDMWSGPAALGKYNVNHHRGWNHFWNYSGGDIINDGVHQIDLARWLIGQDYPKTVYSVGGRFNEEGVFETPDTQIAVYEFDNLVMTFELTLYTPYMLKTDMELRNNQEMYPYWPQNAARIEIYGSEGLMYVGRHGGGWQVFDRPKSRQPVVAEQDNGPFPDPEHKENFCQAIRSRDLPSADIEEGHKSTLLCQLANISYRLGGEKLYFDPATETCKGSDKANALLKREYRSPWIVPETV
ncbi:MAG: Gfo/Idh/MocA family oxidoreductase [Pirellulales bacterium]|nr:Gfo/Idh/MocA family oxidoreductase [Pirellulales bacterium]